MRILLLLSLLGCDEDVKSDKHASDTSSGTSPGHDSPIDPAVDTAGDSGEIPEPSGCQRMDGQAIEAQTCAREAHCTWESDQISAYSGYAVAAGLDVDGDGWEDIIVGAPLYDVQTMTSGLFADGGSVQFISGAAIGDLDHGIGGRLGGRDDGDLLGSAVTLVPDLNGDGLAEIAAGARGSAASGESYSGEVLLLLGSAEGWAEDEDAGTLIPTSRWVGERAYSRAGKALKGGIDTDGDGLGELWVSGELKQTSPSSTYEYNGPGRIYRISGGAETWPEMASLADADAMLDGEDAMGGAGLSLAAEADLDGDGYGDLVIGAPYATANKGTVYLVAGGPDALTGSISLADVPVQLTGDASGDTYGWTVAVGDITGDGQPDLAVGAPMSNASTPDAGLVSIYTGTSSMLTDAPTLQTRIAGEFDDHQLGTGLVAGRDLTGDGRDDLVMGAVNAWQGLITKGGRSYILAGSPALGEMMSARFTTQQVYGSQVKEYLGRAMALSDLDGDGTADLLIGTGYRNGEEGTDSGGLYLFWGG